MTKTCRRSGDLRFGLSWRAYLDGCRSAGDVFAPACGALAAGVLILAAFALASCGCARQATAQPELRGRASAGFVAVPEDIPPQEAAPTRSAAPEPEGEDTAERQPTIAPVWLPLRERLARDGVRGPRVDELLAGLGPLPSQSPMGRKMRELYRRKFMPAPKAAKEGRYYKGVVTEPNAALCREFIKANRQAFDLGEKRYGVPPSIACALLFVETRLGRVLGDVPENALYTLASMSVCRSPDDIDGWLDRLPGYGSHLDWMRQTMEKRADWAYRETRALIEHMLKHDIGPDRLPGSIYGAVGLCQFMPSNISSYGADGDGDGRVDLFEIPDAVASLSNYLARHGWKKGLGEAGRAEVLMSYNHSRVYADTILALAHLIAASPAGTAR